MIFSKRLNAFIGFVIAQLGMSSFFKRDFPVCGECGFYFYERSFLACVFEINFIELSAGMGG